MGLHQELPVYKACYDLLLEIFRFTKDFTDDMVGINDYFYQELKIYPNPFTHSTIIEFPNPEHKKYMLRITTLTGSVVKNIYNITESQIEFNRNGMPAGVYVIELRGPKIFKGRLLIE